MERGARGSGASCRTETKIERTKSTNERRNRVNRFKGKLTYLQADKLSMILAIATFLTTADALDVRCRGPWGSSHAQREGIVTVE